MLQRLSVVADQLISRSWRPLASPWHNDTQVAELKSQRDQARQEALKVLGGWACARADGSFMVGHWELPRYHQWSENPWYSMMADGFDCRNGWWLITRHRDSIFDVYLFGTLIGADPDRAPMGHQWEPVALITFLKALEVSQPGGPQMQQPTAWLCPFVASLNDLYRSCVGMLTIPELANVGRHWSWNHSVSRLTMVNGLDQWFTTWQWSLTMRLCSNWKWDYCHFYCG